MQLYLHDQKDDATIDQYSVQTETGAILFMFNPVGITAREVMQLICAAGKHTWTNPTPERPGCSTMEILGSLKTSKPT